MSMTLADVATFLFGHPERHFCRVSISGQGSSTEEFYEARGGHGWRQVGPYGAGNAPTLNEIVTENSWAHVKWAPCLTLAPVASELAPWNAVWCVINLAQVAPGRGDIATDRAGMLRARLADLHSRTATDPDVAAATIGRVRALEPAPNVLINEGDRLALVWKLSAPLAEACTSTFKWTESRAVRIMSRLAAQLEGDRRFAALPHEALLSVPGLKRDDIAMAGATHHIVSAELIHEGPIDIEALEWWTSEGLSAEQRARKPVTA
jgi:hypothetical protein